MGKGGQKKMYLVTQGKRGVNQLCYTPKNHTYTYMHKGVKVWEIVGGSKLFDYFQEQRNKGEFVDINICYSFPIYRTYSQSCEYFEKQEQKKMQNFPKIIEVIK